MLSQGSECLSKLQERTLHLPTHLFASKQRLHYTPSSKGISSCSVFVINTLIWNLIPFGMWHKVECQDTFKETLYCVRA